MPIDPVIAVSSSDVSPMAPPYVDEDVNVDLVQQGMEIADSETRDTVADAYEATARLSDDPEEAFNDIDYSKDDDSSSPELSAMHEEMDEEAEDFEE